MAKNEKIAIAGAGLTGAYLYRLLKNKGFTDIVLYEQDRLHRTRCGITPCAWGVSSEFKELISQADLEPDKYILRELDYVIIDEVELKANLLTIDKPKLIQDLLRGANIIRGTINPSDFDRVIDATGVSRAYLPKIKDDIILNCVQYCVHSDIPLKNRIKLGRIGYAWTFPLGDNEYHIGCGSYVDTPVMVLHNLGWLDKVEYLCGCSSKVRLTSPAYSTPFVYKNIWGIGEAIGCVAPLAGDGIIPGMQSVHGLVKNWYDSEGYRRYIQAKFAWMYEERKVLDKLIKGEELSFGDGLILQRNAKRMGIAIRLPTALRLLMRLRE